MLVSDISERDAHIRSFAAGLLPDKDMKLGSGS